MMISIPFTVMVVIMMIITSFIAGIAAGEE